MSHIECLVKSATLRTHIHTHAHTHRLQHNIGIKMNIMPIRSIHVLFKYESDIVKSLWHIIGLFLFSSNYPTT